MGKKSKRTSSRVLTLIFMLIVGMVGEDYISVDPVLRKVKQLVSECAPSWKLDMYYEEEDENGVKCLHIQWRDEPEDNLYVEDMYKIYSSLTQYLLEGEEAPYQGWNLRLGFLSTNRARDLVIRGINEKKDNIDLYSNTGIPVKDLAQYFPEVSSLYLEPDFCNKLYESIDEIAGFHNLKYFHIEPGITEEEKETILSIFPDCQVDCEIKEQEAIKK